MRLHTTPIEPRNHPSNQHSGLSVVEVLVVLGLIAVLFSFGSPMFGNAVARAELKATVENLDLSIGIARDTARRYESTVVMHLPLTDGRITDQVTYSSPDHRIDFATVAGFEFPASIRIVASAAEIRFDHRGHVETPVHLELVSADNDELRHLIVVN